MMEVPRPALAPQSCSLLDLELREGPAGSLARAPAQCQEHGRRGHRPLLGGKTMVLPSVLRLSVGLPAHR